MFYRFVGMRRKAIDLDNTFSGACFLVGGGYQLSQVKEQLNDPRIVTMAMNNVATQINPTLWVGADTTEHYSESILMNPNPMKFMYVTRKDGTVINQRARDMSNMYFTVGLGCEPKECFLRQRNFGWWKNVFMYAVQLIHRLGFNRLYAVSCGLKIDDKQGAYGYQSDLTPEEIAYNRRTYAMVIRQLSSVLEYAREAQFDIISCTPDSALNALIPYRSFDEVYAEEIAKVPDHRTEGLKHPKRGGAEPATVVEAVPTERTQKLSVLIPTFNRDELLEFGLRSIAAQKLANAEKFVLNDGPHSEQTKKIAETYGAMYVHTGTRFNNDENAPWRVPGFAFNVGAKLATGDILVLMCPEMWHMQEDTLERLVVPVVQDPNNIGIPAGKDDDGTVLKALREDQKSVTMDFYNALTVPELRAELPFLLAISKASYLKLGGYDEDFIGRCYDDDDLIGRLKDAGHKFVPTSANCVHLWHKRQTLRETKDAVRVQLNKQLFTSRKGQVERNVGRAWGVLGA